jgi:hypothetical protein
VKQAGGALLHPLPLAAIAVLVLNDHVLKRAWPGLVTGKLSDLVGLAFFPLFLLSLCELAGARRTLRLFAVCAALTALVFALVKTQPWALWTYRHGLGLFHGAPVAAVLDPTDLVCLPAVLAGLWPLLRQRRTESPAAPA